MRMLLPLVGSLLLMAPSAQATPVFDVTTVNCVGSQALSLADAFSLTCDGDLSLAEGTVSASTKVGLTSFASLSLQQLTISAPEVELSANSIFIGSGVSITANSLIVSAEYGGPPPSIYIDAGATFIIGTGSEVRIVAPQDVIQSFGPGPVTGGGSITLMPGVPEPSAWVLLLAGLVGILVTVHSRPKGARREHA